MRSRVTGAACAVSALAVCFAAPNASLADPTSPTPTSTVTLDAHHDAGGLADEELQRQISRAEALIAELVDGDATMADVIAKLEKSNKRTNAALEVFATARNEERDATVKAQSQSDVAAALQDRLDQARQELRDWAVSAYTQGGPLAEQLGYLDALTQDASKVSNPLSDLNYLTDNRIRTVEDLREVAVQQRAAAMAAEREQEKANAARKRAQVAKVAAEKVLKAQKAQLKDLQKAHAEKISEAGPLATLLIGTGDADAVAASERLTEALETVNVAVKDMGLKPCSQDDGTYPNGQIPPAALCPMLGSSDEFLAPKAAAAFNAMSKAYAEDTGSLLCVTDGYRSYAEQVAVKASRGMWAATPGTSNHGYGVAVDLCGGVNDYSAPAHLWMVQNAGLYGWFHPSWAAQGGRLPEPWHWEYAG